MQKRALKSGLSVEISGQGGPYYTDIFEGPIPIGRYEASFTDETLERKLEEIDACASLLRAAYRLHGPFTVVWKSKAKPAKKEVRDANDNLIGVLPRNPMKDGLASGWITGLDPVAETLEDMEQEAEGEGLLVAIVRAILAGGLPEPLTTAGVLSWAASEGLDPAANYINGVLSRATLGNDDSNSKKFFRPHGPRDARSYTLIRVVEEFVLGQQYHRRNHLHRPYGGTLRRQLQHSDRFRITFMFLERGELAEGLRDIPLTELDAIKYVSDPAKRTAARQVLEDHVREARQLFVFESLDQESARFVGEFEYVHPEPKDDDTILLQRCAPAKMPSPGEDEALPEASGAAFTALRDGAYAAAALGTLKSSRESTRSYYQRSQVAARYVRARAGGVCEGCGQPAPFSDRHGNPYLEAHHIHRKADGGPDHPESMAAICPNCHRKVHHGAEGLALNEKLSRVALEKERLAASLSAAG